MEKIIRITLMEHLLSNELLTNQQHGFVTGKSCITNLLETFDLITQANEDGFPTDIAFLDFAKAFDSVPHERLCIKLQAYGIKDDLLNWFKAFLSNRTQRLILGNSISEWLMVLSGIPQGSVISTLLFIIYINDLTEDIKNNCKLYADDTKIITIKKNEDDVLNLQNNINKLYNAQANGKYILITKSAK
jgi:hypothetical protein